MNTMNIENFIDTIVESLKGHYPQCEVFARQTLKNNGVRLNSVIIRQHEESVSPAIHLDWYYAAYCSGEATLVGCVDDICRQYEQACRADVTNIDVDDFTEYKAIRNRLRAKLINTEANKERLKDVPAVPFLDLSVVFEIIVQEKDETKASTLVTNELFNRWGVGLDELYREAIDNTKAYCGVEYWSLAAILREQAEAAGVSKEEFDAISMWVDACPMWMLSTQNQCDGAIALVYAQRSKLSEIVGTESFYVLPSSRHEVLLCPNNEYDVEYLHDMVKTVNRDAVLPDNYLSDNVYCYDAESDTFFIV